MSLVLAGAAGRLLGAAGGRRLGRRLGLRRVCSFGLIVDIDGVIVRGKSVLPCAPSAFRRLVDDYGAFRVPTVFVTNAGNKLRKEKADQLSSWLDVEVSEEQVVMSHSPLKMFSDFHKKHVLVSGQGPVLDIARNLGFQQVTTMDELVRIFPLLDAVDHLRRITASDDLEKTFPPLEAIVLFGEPIRWETSLQLLLDVLVTDGLPVAAHANLPYPHIPVLACNTDLQWMSEAKMPRFGHGAFLHCLECLYKKVTGHDLIYTTLVGKPAEITYLHAEQVLQEQAVKMGLPQPVRNLYCVGDNVYTDIFGANLYNHYLRVRRSAEGKTEVQRHGHADSSKRRTESFGVLKPNNDGALNCYSVLVQTGVYTEAPKGHSDHSPRDFLPVEEKFQQPNYVVKNVLDAVDLIFSCEKFT